MKHVNAIYAKRLSQKLWGLIGVTNTYPLYFETRFGIHTFGMNVPIDVVVLDNSMHIIKVKKNLLPKKIFFWNPLYNKVLELPSGMIASHSLCVGDQIVLQEIV